MKLPPLPNQLLQTPRKIHTRPRRSFLLLLNPTSPIFPPRPQNHMLRKRRHDPVQRPLMIDIQPGWHRGASAAGRRTCREPEGWRGWSGDSEGAGTRTG